MASGEWTMEHIVVDDFQAEIICRAPQSIEIRDRQGRCLGYVAHGFTDEDITIAKQRMQSSERRYSTEEVLHHLESLSSQ
jgi:hypothetical protein